MPPSFSGQPIILGEICSHLSQSQLSQVLRVDRQCFAIAGQALYRHVIVHDYKCSPLGVFQAPWEALAAEPDEAPPSPTKTELLDYIQYLDISETQAILLASTHAASKRRPHPLLRLNTVVLRAKHHMDMDYTNHMTSLSRFGDGWNPDRLVLIGDLTAIARIFGYSRSPSHSLIDLTPNGWPSVRHLTHIIKHENSVIYPSLFYFQMPSRQFVGMLPNLTTYDLFYDIAWSARQRPGTSRNCPELHFARAVAWIIRNTPNNLPLDIWLSVESQTAFIDRRRLINKAIRQPFDDAEMREMGEDESAFDLWNEERFSLRVKRVRARLCGFDREDRWCEVSDGRMYDENLIVRKRPVCGTLDADGESDDGQVDWEDIKPWDHGEEYTSSDEYDDDDDDGEEDDGEGGDEEADWDEGVYDGHHSGSGEDEEW